jgi:(4S)-4-hydroxy-5-phosphonooxypentane-2,3-dione isomerase
VTVVLAVTWIAKDEEADTVAGLLEQMVPLSRAEPGCLQYDVHRDRDDPSRFFIFERYVDEAALEAHGASEHFQQLAFGDAIPRLVSRERRYLIPLDA